MLLAIDTTQANHIKLSLKHGTKTLTSQIIATTKNQNELLLPAVESLLSSQNLKLHDLTAIEVANGEGTFSSLRLGITTANALGYALGIPVSDNSGLDKKTAGLQIIDPIYDGEPNTGIKNPKPQAPSPK